MSKNQILLIGFFLLLHSTSSKALERISNYQDTTYSTDWENPSDSLTKKRIDHLGGTIYSEDEDNQQQYLFQKPDSVFVNKADSRILSKEFVSTLKDDKAFDYVKTGLPKEKSKNRTSLPQFNFNRFWLLVPIVLFAIFLLYYLYKNNLLLFRKKSATLYTESKEDQEKDIFSIPFSEAISKALNQNNFRLAIRLQYLQILKSLSQKGIINYLPDKTNHDYLAQLRSSVYYDEFFTATRNYEYSWYGLFDIDKDKYNQIQQTFSSLQTKIGN